MRKPATPFEVQDDVGEHPANARDAWKTRAARRSDLDRGDGRNPCSEAHQNRRKRVAKSAAEAPPSGFRAGPTVAFFGRVGGA